MSTVTQITASGETRDIEDSRIGNLSSLQTSEKTSIVGAINEVANKGGGLSFTSLSIPNGLYSSTIRFRNISLDLSKYLVIPHGYIEPKGSPVIDSSLQAVYSTSPSEDDFQLAESVFEERFTDLSTGRTLFLSGSFVARIGEPGASAYCNVVTQLQVTKVTASTAYFALVIQVHPLVITEAGTWQDADTELKNPLV